MRHPFNGFTKTVREEFYKAMDTAQSVFDYMRYGRSFPAEDTTERRSELRGIESLLRDVVDEIDRCRRQLREWQKRNLIMGLIQIAVTTLLLIAAIVIHL